MLTVQQLESGYGESMILRGLNMRVEPGQVVCLMGRNGVGKTTFMRTLMGTLPVRRGSISWNGQTIGTYSPDRRARLGIGYVPQGRDIFAHLSVEDNLLLGLEASRSKQPLPFLRKFRGNAGGDSFPEDVLDLFPILRGMLKRKGGDLSGGQQQQLAIARVLASRPKLLLLDEPMEGIQPSVVELIEGVIESIKRKRDTAVILVEQSLDFACRIADYSYIMERGSIIAEGPPEQLTMDLVKTHLAV